MPNILWCFPIASAGLGGWQLYRLKWKLGIIADLEDGIRRAPSHQTNDNLYHKPFKFKKSFNTEL